MEKHNTPTLLHLIKALKTIGMFLGIFYSIAALIKLCSFDDKDKSHSWFFVVIYTTAAAFNLSLCRIIHIQNTKAFFFIYNIFAVITIITSFSDGSIWFRQTNNYLKLLNLGLSIASFLSLLVTCFSNEAIQTQRKISLQPINPFKEDHPRLRMSVYVERIMVRDMPEAEIMSERRVHKYAQKWTKMASVHQNRTS